jgi:CheY-like chemotaxis protein
VAAKEAGVLAPDENNAEVRVMASSGEAVRVPLLKSFSCEQLRPDLGPATSVLFQPHPVDAAVAVASPQLGGAARPAAENAATGAELPKLKILIAEDNKINQLVVQKVLRMVMPTSSVTIVEDGQAAVAAIMGHKDFDLVLMDLHMPKMGGLEASKKVREVMPDRPRIVALTADTVADVGRKCLEAGMNDYVTKPFHVNDMRRILGLLPRPITPPSDTCS